MVKRIARESRSFWPQYTGLLSLYLVSIGIALLAPIPVKIVIDCIFGSKPLPAWVTTLFPKASGDPHLLLFIAPCLLVAITLLTYIQGSGSWLLQTYTAERMIHRFRAKLFRHAQRLPLAYHDTKTAADSAFRIQYDAGSIQQVVLQGFLPLFTAVMRLVCMFWVTARIDLQLALIALGISPLLYLLTHGFRGALRRKWGQVRELESSVASSIQEVLGSMRVVKAFVREEHEDARFTRRSSHRVTELLRVAALQGSFDFLVGITIALTTAIALYVAILHVHSGILTLGDLTLVTAYVVQLLDPLKGVSKNIVDLQGGLANAQRAFELLDHPIATPDVPGAIPIERAHGNIKFEHVSFAYDGTRSVLRDVSLEIPAGARIGISGRSGSGKSTLVNLLNRFYDVKSGRILLDGIDLRDYRIADLRNQFAIVQQDVVLFSASIAENIAYGCPGAAHDRIVRAAKQANAHEFISKLRDGYSTQVGERGLQLSGGERQRISLARAFLKNAPILILDEPTSAMDTGTERAIMQALERLMHGRTTFMVAHRLSTLESCDLRLHLDAGRADVLTQDELAGCIQEWPDTVLAGRG